MLCLRLGQLSVAVKFMAVLFARQLEQEVVVRMRV